MTDISDTEKNAIKAAAACKIANNICQRTNCKKSELNGIAKSINKVRYTNICIQILIAGGICRLVNSFTPAFMTLPRSVLVVRVPGPLNCGSFGLLWYWNVSRFRVIVSVLVFFCAFNRSHISIRAPAERISRPSKIDMCDFLSEVAV